jgi:hypothetical protein
MVEVTKRMQSWHGPWIEKVVFGTPHIDIYTVYIIPSYRLTASARIG